MKLRQLTAIILLYAVFTGMAQTTTRKKLRPANRDIGREVVHARRDTVTDPGVINKTVEISDFSKTVASRVESVLITNKSESDTVFAVTVDIDYRTPAGRQLNKRTVTFRVTVPPGETRHASVQSWDRQQLFYFIDTPPARKSQRTSPFTVSIVPETIEISPAAD